MGESTRPDERMGKASKTWSVWIISLCYMISIAASSIAGYAYTTASNMSISDDDGDIAYVVAMRGLGAWCRFPLTLAVLGLVVLLSDATRRVGTAAWCARPRHWRRWGKLLHATLSGLACYAASNAVVEVEEEESMMPAYNVVSLVGLAVGIGGLAAMATMLCLSGVRTEGSVQWWILEKDEFGASTSESMRYGDLKSEEDELEDLDRMWKCFVAMAVIAFGLKSIEQPSGRVSFSIGHSHRTENSNSGSAWTSLAELLCDNYADTSYLIIMISFQALLSSSLDYAETLFSVADEHAEDNTRQSQIAIFAFLGKCANSMLVLRTILQYRFGQDAFRVVQYSGGISLTILPDQLLFLAVLVFLMASVATMYAWNICQEADMSETVPEKQVFFEKAPVAVYSEEKQHTSSMDQ